jgi:hypothetical protein
MRKPEITGDPSYDGFGEITIPTSMGDVTIDLDTEEDWGNWDDKAKENQVKEKFRELEQGRQKYREWQAKENRQIRDKYWVDPMDGEQDHISPLPEMSWLDADWSKMQKGAIVLCMAIAFVGIMMLTGGLGAVLLLGMLEGGLISATGVLVTAIAGHAAYDLGRSAAGKPSIGTREFYNW